MSAWQPIETAPIEEWVLVAGPAARTSSTQMVARQIWNGEWESADDGNRPYMDPTHWQPLPAPPEAA